MNAATNDSSVESTTREILRIAMRRARQNPEVLLNAAYIAHFSDKNCATVEGPIGKALTFDQHSDTRLATVTNLIQWWDPDSGECQDSCRMSRHAAVRPGVSRSSFVGFSRTVVTGVQLRLAPRQRAGCWARAGA